MHAMHLAQIATNFARVGHALASEEVRAAGDSAHGFWLANRFRCDVWHQRISSHRSAIERCGTSRRARLWREIVPTLQEILISEPLTRVVACLASSLEKRQADADWGALAHSVLASHIEARHRCLNLMVFGHGFPVEKAVNLNRLRRLLEFYNDQLLAALPPLPQLERYAFEPATTAVHQREFRSYTLIGPWHQVRLQLLATSLGNLLAFDHDSLPANPQFNQSIAETALAMLPPGVFDSFGVARSRMHAMIARVAKDSNVYSDDFVRPLAAPFDLLTPHGRHPRRKSRRMGL